MTRSKSEMDSLHTDTTKPELHVSKMSYFSLAILFRIYIHRQIELMLIQVYHLYQQQQSR
jgi:hypothetical protein